MTVAQLLLKEIEETPPDLIPEVRRFIRFLRQETGEKRFDGLRLSESALKPDWSSPEEDEAWKNL